MLSRKLIIAVAVVATVLVGTALLCCSPGEPSPPSEVAVPSDEPSSPDTDSIDEVSVDEVANGHQVIQGPFALRYWLVSSERIGRTTFRYIYRAEINNDGPSSIPGVSAAVSSVSVATAPSTS